MAAPFRGACVGRVVIFNNFVIGQSSNQLLRVLCIASRNASHDKKHEDFFGIEEDQRYASKDEPVPSVADEKVRDAEMRKLLQLSRKEDKNAEVVIQAPFGQVRLDKNARKSHLPEFDSAKFLQRVSNAGSINYKSSLDIDNQPSVVVNQSSRQKRSSTQEARVKSQSHNRQDGEKVQDAGPSSMQQDVNYFDEQYFGVLLATEIVQPDTQAKAANVQLQDRMGLSDSDKSLGSISQQDAGKLDYVTSRSVAGWVNDGVSDGVSLPSAPVDDAADNFIDQTYFPSLTHSSDSAATSPIDTQNRDSFVDEQYFSQLDDSQESFRKKQVQEVKGENSSNLQSSSQGKPLMFEGDVSFIDSQFLHHEDSSVMSTQTTDLKYQSQSKNSDHSGEGVSGKVSNKDVNFIEAQYFEENQVSTQKNAPFDGLVNQYGFTADKTTDGLTQTTSTTHEEKRESLKMKPTIAKDVLSQQSPQEEEEENQFTATEKDDSAYGVAMEIRKGLRLNLTKEKSEDEVPKDKARVKAIREQLPDLHNMPAAEVAKLLADSIIFENDDFVAINKPYGLPSHGGPGVRVSVGQVLEPLGRRVHRGRHQLQSLHLVHRLDKETTGIMLLAKNAEVAWTLLGMFRRREVGKTYWTLTKGLPQPSEGVVNIPLIREKVGEIYKTVIKPEAYISGGQDRKIRKQRWRGGAAKAQEAVTEYQVLSAHHSMALVECRPRSGLQHQIRAHLAQALNSPVLGDHKYSHHDRLAPQKLFPEALQKLGIRQAQVRHVPMHLHAKALLLPEWRGHSNIFIKAPVPRFFLRSLKTLKIKIPPK